MDPSARSQVRSFLADRSLPALVLMRLLGIPRLPSPLFVSRSVLARNCPGPADSVSPPDFPVATYATSGALASSRDALRADSDLRAYGPCHRRDGTAGTPELLPQLAQPGLGTNSDDYGPAATCRSMDLAAAAGARATRTSRLWAGDAAGGQGPEQRRATGPTTTRPPGAGRRVSPVHGTRSCHKRQSTWHVQGYWFH